VVAGCRLHLKCDGTHAETRFHLSVKQMSPFKLAGASVQSTTGSWGVHISGSNAGYTMFRGSVKGTGYPLHSPVSPSLPLPCVTMCHHISTGLYHQVSTFCPQNACMYFIWISGKKWQLFMSVALTDRFDKFSVWYRLNLYVQFRLILGFKWLGGDIR
jgi:hypothetical protein